MHCDRVRAQLTPYLDGELDGDRGTVVRGHLRSCEACRAIAEDEAALRDGLRALPSVDPPSNLWSAVQARLADEEVAEAKRPAWRRAFVRWGRYLPSAPRFAMGAAVAVLVIGVVVWKTGPDSDEHVAGGDPPSKPLYVPPPNIQPDHNKREDFASKLDVTDDLASEPARTASLYQRTIDELLAVAGDMKSGWSDDRKVAFEMKVKTMRDTIARADEGKPKHRASRALIRYLEAAVIRDDVTFAGGVQ